MDLSKLLSDIAAKKAWGVKLADYLSSTAKLKNFVNLQFASEVRQEVVRDISKSVLSKSRYTSYMPLWKKFWDRNVYKVLEWRDFYY